MDRLFTGRRIINSENHLRGFIAYYDKKSVFRLFLHSAYQPSRKSEICRCPFSLAAAEKGGWAQAACPSGLRQALTTPKCSSAGACYGSRSRKPRQGTEVRLVSKYQCRMVETVPQERFFFRARVLQNTLAFDAFPTELQLEWPDYLLNDRDYFSFLQF